MASNNQAPAFVVMALILFAAANPLSHAQQLLGSLLPGLSPILNGLSPIVPGVLNSVSPVVPGVLNSLSPVVPGVLNSLSPVVPGILNSVSPVVPGVLNSVSPVVPGVLNSISPAVSGVLNGLSPIVSGVVGGVSPVVPGVVNGVSPVVPGVVNGVSPVVPGVVNGLSPPVSGLLSGLSVSGVLCCTPNGNCPAGATGIAGVQVKLNCTNLVGGTVTIGQGTVGANGGFNISVFNVLSTLGGLFNSNSLIPCSVVVPLPLNQTICPILYTVTGALIGVVSTVQSVTSTATGLIGSVTVPTFSSNATVQA